jgi:hypothetical protein
MTPELILFFLACVLCFGTGWGLAKVNTSRKYQRQIAEIQHNVAVYVAHKHEERH